MRSVGVNGPFPRPFTFSAGQLTYQPTTPTEMLFSLNIFQKALDFLLLLEVPLVVSFLKLGTDPLAISMSSNSQSRPSIPINIIFVPLPGLQDQENINERKNMAINLK